MNLFCIKWLEVSNIKKDTISSQKFAKIPQTFIAL